MRNVVDVLMQRDNLTRDQAADIVAQCRDALEDAESFDDAEMIVVDYLGLEPDYVLEVMEFKGTASGNAPKHEHKWMGTWPASCDICGVALESQEYFIDGATRGGPWGLLCEACHRGSGVGLGTGRGQKYRTSDLVKVEG